MMLQKFMIMTLSNSEITFRFWSSELVLNIRTQLEPYCNYVDTSVNYVLGTATKNGREMEWKQCFLGVCPIVLLWSWGNLKICNPSGESLSTLQKGKNNNKVSNLGIPTCYLRFL